MRKRNAPLINIGTSGWYYEHWNGTFYPKEIVPNEKLEFYTHFFSTVEINNTFYHLPKEQTVKNWAAKTPQEFVFSVKASQYITHLKRLKDYQKSTPLFFSKIKLLKNKLGPILFQLPPSFKLNMERLEDFISHLPQEFLCVFEFRDSSWFIEEVYELLNQYNIGLCITDLNKVLSPLVVTADFTYIRLHGPKSAYQGSYNLRALEQWKKRIVEWSEQKITTFCYFDNDEKGYAIKDALKLKNIMNK